jgi:hypothetical protein
MVQPMGSTSLGLRAPRHPPRSFRPASRGDDSGRLQEVARLSRSPGYFTTRRRGLHPAVADRSRRNAQGEPTCAPLPSCPLLAVIAERGNLVIEAVIGRRGNLVTGIGALHGPDHAAAAYLGSTAPDA